MADWDSTFDYTIMINHINQLNSSIDDQCICPLNANITEMQNMAPELVAMVQDDIDATHKKVLFYQAEITKTNDLLNRITIVQALSLADKKVLYDMYTIVGGNMEMFAQVQLFYYNELITEASPILATSVAENLKNRMLLKIYSKYISNVPLSYFPMITPA